LLARSRKSAASRLEDERVLDVVNRRRVRVLDVEKVGRFAAGHREHTVLPPVPPILTKYMDPPPQVAARAEGVARKVKEVCRSSSPGAAKFWVRLVIFCSFGGTDCVGFCQSASDYAAVFGATKAGKFDSSAATTAPAVEDASLKPKTTLWHSRLDHHRIFGATNVIAVAARLLRARRCSGLGRR
jgi:hypothetical protein